MAENQKPMWYVLHTYSGYENKVAASIATIVENRKLSEKIVDVKIPMEKVIEVKNDQQKEVERKIFPGYVMVNMIIDDDLRYIIRNVRGVTGFVGSANEPIPLSEAEALALFSAGGDEASMPIKEGDFVQINDEGFTAPGGGMWTGTVASVDAKNKTVKVSVDMYGAATIIEVPIENVEAF